MASTESSAENKGGMSSPGPPPMRPPTHQGPPGPPGPQGPPGAGPPPMPGQMGQQSDLQKLQNSINQMEERGKKSELNDIISSFRIVLNLSIKRIADSKECPAVLPS